MSASNKDNIPKKLIKTPLKNGFYYNRRPNNKVDFSNLQTFPKSFSPHDNFLWIKEFVFYKNGIRVCVFHDVAINLEKTIIMIENFSVELKYLLQLKRRNGGRDSLIALANEVKKTIDSVNQIQFKVTLTQYTLTDTIIDNTLVIAKTKRDSLKNTLLLAEKIRDLLNKIKANGVYINKYINKYNNSDSFIVNAKWLKKDW
ncbi:hypothetical protein B6D19_09700 [Gilliamella apicola]|uniref:hypothetical protein n=1 Tax=Gilliamella apicola TaxID=1196095 RepID=UPI000A348658|nr:hypothetical protein [Gilliamella apicola]OTQ31255.1 hypothetical protein B6D19_09700 [Gilliamella apicola]OTQ40931.1 hypothetical protein B6D20_09685 [Gilliamella apicola]